MGRRDDGAGADESHDCYLAPGPADEPERYVGLETGEAERQARSRGWRILRSVPPGAMVTMEFRPGRLNFEVEADRVKRAWRG